MSNLLIHNMETAGWASSAPLTFRLVLDNQTFVEGSGASRINADYGTINEFVQLSVNPSLSLNNFEELRFWIRSNRAAEGTASQPFYLEFSYVDNNDAPDETHRWLVPINRSGVWEHRRIGIENDRRGEISAFRFTRLTADSFVCNIDEMLAVHEEMIGDLEQALVSRIENQLTLTGATNVALSQQANPNDTQVVITLNPNFNPNNRVVVRGGTSGDELHTITAVQHNQATNNTTLSFGPSDKVKGTLNATVASVSIAIPALFESPAVTTSSNPAILISLMDPREDLERTGYGTQRDSFRRRGNLTTCSVRPLPRAYALIYQLTTIAPTRTQQLQLHNSILQRLSADIPLRINGVASPVWIVPPPTPLESEVKSHLGLLAPVIVRIGTRMEVAGRLERPWVQQARLDVARIDAPLDHEGLVIQT